MKITPAPITTKITKDEFISQTWQNWFVPVSKNLEDSTKILTTSGVNIHYFGNVGTIIYSGISTSFDIPIKESSINQNIPYYFFDTVWNIGFIQLVKGTKILTIPNGEIAINSNFFVIS